MSKFFTASSFTDYKGEQHTVTVCITDDDITMFKDVPERMVGYYGYGYHLGWSCRNAKDSQNDDLAKTIAYNRAIGSLKKEPHFNICGTYNGLFKAKFNELAPAIALSYITYLIENPSIMIKGYKHSMKKFLEKKK